MLTPSDIQNKRFDKGMSGYRAEDVHAFLNEAADTVQSLTEDNEDLQRKLEILAEKVEQYREDEDSLRAALIGAQKLGDSVVRDAKRKAEAIIAQATRKAEELVIDAQSSIDKESMALTRMQKEVAKFKGQILQMYKSHIELIQNIPEYEEEVVEPPVKNSGPFVANIGETVEVKTSQEESPEDVPEEESGEDLKFELVNGEEEGTVENPDAFPVRKSKYSKNQLKFGDDYQLTRKE